MKHSTRVCMLATLGGCLLLGCSQGDPASAPLSSDAASGSAAVKVATDDPCSLLSDDEVSKVFPGSASGKRDRSVDGYGILSCTWETPIDRFVVQVSVPKSGTVEDELRSRLFGSIDPTIAGAGSRVRYEKIGGIGDGAMLAVENADPKAGIISDTAVMVTQRGNRRAVLFTGSSLAGRDRASAREALQTLGKRVAERL